MKIPQPRNSPISRQRIERWVSAFEGYRHAITEASITDWMAQFRNGHRDTAARVLDCVEFVPVSQLTALFRQTLNSLPGWNAAPEARQGRWIFSALSTSAGESGDSMLHRFRLANGLGPKKFNSLFRHRSELLAEGLGPDDSVVFVDDFAGTGKQVVDAWDEYFSEVVPDSRLYLILAAATKQAVERISEGTSLIVNPGFRLTQADNVFSEMCTHFSPAEKEEILNQCTKADRRAPRGFGDCGLLLVFAHNCPNNSIPILHVVNAKWHGLFRRYDQ